MKRIFAAWLLALALVAPAVAQDLINPQTDQSQLTRNKGQLPGTATNDAAAAGKVGEIAAANLTAGTATVTFSNGSSVVTWTAHPFPINASGIVSASGINFTNSGGALPTNFVAGTNYYAVPIDANTLHIGSSVANALAGTFITAGSAGTGTQTGKAQVLLTSTVSVDYGGVALPAGDWDCNGSFGVLQTRSVTSVNGWIGTASATAAANTAYTNLALAFTSALTVAVPLSPTQTSVASTTNIFFSGAVAFGSTASGFGYFRCRRMR